LAIVVPPVQPAPWDVVAPNNKATTVTNMAADSVRTFVFFKTKEQHVNFIAEVQHFHAATKPHTKRQ
jgi:hypothetical protein